MIKRRSEKEIKRKVLTSKFSYTRYSIFFNFTLAFVLISEIIISILNFSVNLSLSTQNRMIRSGTGSHTHTCVDTGTTPK